MGEVGAIHELFRRQRLPCCRGGSRTAPTGGSLRGHRGGGFKTRPYSMGFFLLDFSSFDSIGSGLSFLAGTRLRLPMISSLETANPMPWTGKCGVPALKVT